MKTQHSINMNTKATDNIFNKAIKFVLMHEGALSDNIHDKVGITKYGISKPSYPKLNIVNLIINQAKEIYRRDFWNPC